MTLPARSVTPVIVAVYSVCSTRELLGVKVAVVTVAPEQATVGNEVAAAPPPATATVKVDVDVLGQLTSLLKVALMGAPMATPGAPRVGDVEATKGGVVSATLIVSRPQPAIETARSVSADKNHVL
jgi:hypothetical protein